jgi:sterol desaturase/sphingolipid hydroxylase (fatty acid hydroxylase superfamily)
VYYIGIYRCFPLRTRNPWLRGFIIACIFMVIWAAPTIIAFAMACSAGWMARNGDSTCQVTALGYIWLKGLYAGIQTSFLHACEPSCVID